MSIIPCYTFPVLVVFDVRGDIQNASPLYNWAACADSSVLVLTIVRSSVRGHLEYDECLYVLFIWKRVIITHTEHLHLQIMHEGV
jgi:hypothetical protein